MDLILWRHADSPPAAPGQNDLARGLTPKGERQAQVMGRWLDTHLPADTRILVSPAVRCQLTVAGLARPFETSGALAPELSAQGLLHAAGWPRARGTVLVVGHQPTLGEVTAALVAGVGGSWSFKKGAVWWLQGGHAGEGGRADLLTVLSPERL